MKWKEFKKEVERLGIKDTDEILFIDVNYPEAGFIKIYGEPNSRRISDVV